MQLLIPAEIASRLVDALTKAGQREIGGILMGEHVGTDTFRLREITVQRKRGTFATFVRIVSDILSPLRAFFDATKYEYTRFNYLGDGGSQSACALGSSVAKISYILN